MPPTFCYTTSHDYLSVWTTQYSIDFFDKMGHYARIGGLEVARTGDDTWMEEIKRKVTPARPSAPMSGSYRLPRSRRSSR
jgi:hypothetical protein